jgi:serpin B
MDDFALSLTRMLMPEGGQANNLVWSPYSVASALSLAAYGARGETYTELKGALCSAPDGLRLSEAAAPAGAEIAVANTLWTLAGLPIEASYECALRALPGATVHGTAFADEPEAARRAINADIAKTTRDLVKDLLPSGAITVRTVAVLANALYLKIAWRSRFAERGTRTDTFHTPGGPRDVPMMRQTARLPYAESGGWRMVSLAAGRDVVADVLLGPEGGAASSPPLAGLRAAQRTVRVDLRLPRFRIETGSDLTGPLQRLGVRRAFGDRADFSGISPKRLRIDRIEHKAVLDVNEEGFEGAAATAVIMVPASMDLNPPVDFVVDRPFLIVVRHPATAAVYFLAWVADPLPGA